MINNLNPLYNKVAYKQCYFQWKDEQAEEAFEKEFNRSIKEKTDSSLKVHAPFFITPPNKELLYQADLMVKYSEEHKKLPEIGLLNVTNFTNYDR